MEIFNKKNTKFYTTIWVLIGTYLGGPLAGSYLMSKNFEALNQKNYAKNTLLIGIIANSLLFGLLIIIPSSVIDQIPNSMIPLTYTSAIYGLMIKFQDKEIKENLKDDENKQSGWKVIGIVILSLIISFLYVFTLLMLFPINMSE